MSYRVLLSAPYLLPVIDSFRGMLAASGIELVPAPVTERLSEDELMAYAGQVDGLLCGDDQFSRRVQWALLRSRNRLGRSPILFEMDPIEALVETPWKGNLRLEGVPE